MSGFNYSDFSKKSDEPKNYVEMTPEQLAEIESVKEGAKKAAEKAELQNGLNGNKGKDLTKGVTVDGVKPLSNEELAARFGEIREADPAWKRLLNNVYHHSKNFVKEFGEAVTGGAIIVLKGAAFLLPASCSKADEISPGADASVQGTYNPRAFNVVNNRCNILNMGDEEFDAAVIDNDLLSDSDKSRLTKLDFSRQTSDGIAFKYGAEKLADGTGKPFITIGQGANAIKVDITSAAQIPTGDVINYIEQINPDLKCDDKSLHFEEENGKPKVVVENGFTHQVGDKVEINDSSALGGLNKMIQTMGFEPAGEKIATIGANNLLMDYKIGQGEYSNHENSFSKNPNFAFELIERGDLKTITNGQPKVSMKVFDQEISGQLFNENGAVVIKDESGKELVRLSQQTNYDIGAEDEPDPYDGILVQVNGEDFAFISDGQMGKINKQKGTFMTAYKQASSDFDTNGLKEADEFYNEKYKNITTARNTAMTNFNELQEILSANAEAEAKIHIG